MQARFASRRLDVDDDCHREVIILTGDWESGSLGVWEYDYGFR